MKQRILVTIILLLSILCVSAFDVELQSPEEDPLEINEEETVQFECFINEISNAISITLELTKSGTTITSINSTLNNYYGSLIATFSEEINTGGTWTWTCYADSGTEQFTALGSRTIIVSTVNTAPTISPEIPDQNKDINSGTWILDLAPYANDNEEDISNLNWSVSGIDTSICNVEIVSGDIATFTPTNTGSDTITFILTDSEGLTDTENVEITITGQQSSNNPPTISSIPDQNKDLDDSDWTISLNSYISDPDPEDSDDNLIIGATDYDTSIFTVSENQEDNKLTLHIEGEGTDTFTVTVKDTNGATDSTTIKVTIEEETTVDDDDYTDYSSNSNNDYTIEITSSSPSYNNIKISPKQSQKFTILTNENADIAWFIDNTEQDETSKTFIYKTTTSDIGKHKIKVVITSETNDNDKDTKTWDIEVEDTTISTNDCGNDKIDNNETCLTCPEDVPCEQGEYCDEGECKTKQLSKITGFFTSSKNFLLDKWYYPTLVLSIILLLIIIRTIIKINKKPKENMNDYLEEFSEKQTFWKRIQKRLREWDKKRQSKKQNKENLKRLEINKKENIRATAPGVESIISFINQKIYEGNSTGEIKRALRKKGWNRRQIKQAFQKIKNDSRKSTTENKNPSQ